MSDEGARRSGPGLGRAPVPTPAGSLPLGSPAGTPAGASSAEAPLRVLVVDEDERLLRTWRVMLDAGAAEAIQVFGLTDGARALRVIAEQAVDVVVTDVQAGSVSGLDLLDQIRAAHPAVVVVVTGAEPRVDDTVRALKAGAWDFLGKPFLDLEACIARVRAAVAHKRLGDENRLRAARAAEGRVATVWFSLSPVMARLLGQLDRAAQLDTPLLLLGAAGTGKTTLARAAHARSGRASRPCVVFAAGAEHAPEVLAARIAEAAGATLLVEDVDQLTAAEQARLKAALLAPPAHRPRIIATARRGLGAKVEAGAFDADLRWKLATVELTLPPLEARLEDLPHLVHRFLSRAAEGTGRPPPTIDTACLHALRATSWQEGNLNLLARALEHAARVADGCVTEADLPARLREVAEPEGVDLADLVDLDLPWKDAITGAENRIRATYLRGLLDRAEGNMTRAAEAAGLDRSNFRRHVKRYLRGGLDEDGDDEE